MIIISPFYSTKSKIFQKGIIYGWLTKISEIRFFHADRHAGMPITCEIFFCPKCWRGKVRKSHQVRIHYLQWLNHTGVTSSGAGQNDPPPVVVGLKEIRNCVRSLGGTYS